MLVVYAKATDYSKVKDVIENMFGDISYEIDEIGYYPKEKITLDGDDAIEYEKLYNNLEKIEDVSEIYTNVEK